MKLIENPWLQFLTVCSILYGFFYIINTYLSFEEYEQMKTESEMNVKVDTPLNWLNQSTIFVETETKPVVGFINNLLARYEVALKDPTGSKPK